MAIISNADNGFGYRTDEHSDTFELATPLQYGSCLTAHT